MSQSADNFALGDRVRARDIRDVGEDFRGLVGTVVKVADNYYYVNFDAPPPWAVGQREAQLGYQGGGWCDATLEHEVVPVSDEEEAEAIRSILNV